MDVFYRRLRKRIVTTRHEDLVEDDIVVDLKFLIGEPLRNFSRLFAKLFNEALNACAAQGFEHRPKLDDASPVRHRRPEIHAVTMFAPLEIGGRSFKSIRERFAVAAENDPAVVWNIERLVRIERPRIGFFNSFAHFAHRRNGAGPHPESAVPLERWHRLVKAANWISIDDIRRVSPNAKVLNRDRVRFEVAGGNYRLIASFDFRRQIVFVKFIGTHAEYDAIDALTVARF